MTERHELYALDGRLVALCTSREALAAAARLLAPVRVVSRDQLMGVVEYAITITRPASS